ncbi:MAG TPA: hypothetical protein VIO58_14845 [Candidatus Methanoperedens sp.]
MISELYNKAYRVTGNYKKVFICSTIALSILYIAIAVLGFINSGYSGFRVDASAISDLGVFAIGGALGFVYLAFCFRLAFRVLGLVEKE